MSASRSLLEAITAFNKTYGENPRFAEIVGDLMDAMLALQSRDPSPGEEASGKYRQHSEKTFNHAGQEPAERSEDVASIETARELRSNSQPNSARGNSGSSQGTTVYSSFGASTARRRS